MDKEVKTVRNLILWVVGLSMVVSVIWFVSGRTVDTVDTGILHYEEFYEIYHTCKNLDKNLCLMEKLPETDKMFEQFSKAQRMNTVRTQLNRWIEDYNAKSRMFNRSLWKSNSLPYQLSSSQFDCY